MAAIDSDTTNATSGEANVTDSTLLGPGIILVVNYVTLLISLIIVVMEIILVVVLQNCRRIPHRTRWLSTSFLLSDLLGAAIFASHQMLMFVFGYNNDLTHASRTVAVGIVLAISWASVAAMSIDRVLAIKMNLKYTSCTKYHTGAAIAVIWLFHIISITVISALGLKEKCDFDHLEDCDGKAASEAARFAMLGMLVLYEVVVIISYAYIHKVASRHVKYINALKIGPFQQNSKSAVGLSDRQLNTTHAVLKIVLAFWILHAPLIIHLFVFEFDLSSRYEIPRKVFHAFSYLCIQINSFVSMSLYGGKFKEVKMHFYFLLGKLCSSYQLKGELLRIEVCNVVISSEALGRRASLA